MHIAIDLLLHLANLDGSATTAVKRCLDFLRGPFFLPIVPELKEEGQQLSGHKSVSINFFVHFSALHAQFSFDIKRKKERKKNKLKNA